MAENKHTSYDLAQMQSLPLSVKVEMTKRRIQEWYEHWEGQVYVSFSGGKDSTVLKHIVDSMYDDVPSVFVDTGLEYPEVRKFVLDVRGGQYPELRSNVEILHPKMRFDEVIQTYGYPAISKEVAMKIYYAQRGSKQALKAMRGEDKNGNPSAFRKRFIKYAYLIDSGIPISAHCCTMMKKAPVHVFEKETKRKPIIGTLAEESYLRTQKWMKNGCNAFESNRPISQPLAF